MNKKQSQSGSAHLIIIILLIVALVGTLGFVFYQNFIQKEDSIVKTDQSSNTLDKDDNPIIDDTNVETDLNEGYLVLDDWNVKFKLPTDLADNQIVYSKGNDYRSEDSYSFITERVRDLGDGCAVDGAHLAILFRTTTARGVDDLFPNSSVKSAGKVGDYNYYIDPTVLGCSNGNNDAFQVQDRNMLTDFLMSVEEQ